LKSPEWETVASNARMIALVPPFLPTETYSCDDKKGFELDDVLSLGMLAARSKILINSGMVSRLPSKTVEPYCARFLRDFKEGRLDPSLVYVAKDGWTSS